MTDEPSPIVGVIRTPYPWGEGVMPTAEQLADWLAICTPAERVEVAAAAILSGQEARACFEQNHVGRIGRMEAYERDVAWLSDNTLSWALEMDPHASLYEDRETYLREHFDGAGEAAIRLLAAETVSHLWEVQCYPNTPVGFRLTYGATAAEAVRLMRESVEAER